MKIHSAKFQERRSKIPLHTKRNPQLPRGRVSVPFHLFPAMSESQQMAKDPIGSRAAPLPQSPGN